VQRQVILGRRSLFSRSQVLDRQTFPSFEILHRQLVMLDSFILEVIVSTAWKRDYRKQRRRMRTSSKDHTSAPVKEGC
jgi:hypothetical protein